MKNLTNRPSRIFELFLLADYINNVFVVSTVLIIINLSFIVHKVNLVNFEHFEERMAIFWFTNNSFIKSKLNFRSALYICYIFPFEAQLIN